MLPSTGIATIDTVVPVSFFDHFFYIFLQFTFFNFSLLANLLQCDVMLLLMQTVLKRALDLKARSFSDSHLQKVRLSDYSLYSYLFTMYYLGTSFDWICDSRRKNWTLSILHVLRSRFEMEYSSVDGRIGVKCSSEY